jgi:DNA-binding SARP family transcriptional activator
MTHAKRWLDQNQPERALEAAELALELEPCDETCVRFLMQAELNLGNRGRALQAYEALEEKLELELGVAPSISLSDFAADIRGRG